MLKTSGAIVLGVFLCSACAFDASNNQVSPRKSASIVAPPRKLSLIDYSYDATDALLKRLSVQLDKSKGILIASLANVDDLEQSSRLGRTISDQYTSYLVNQGYAISEIKLRNDLLMKKKEGEFMLSRDAKKLLRSHNVQAVLVGTYSVGEDNVYVTARLINPVDEVIISAVDYKIPVDSDIKAMLRVRPNL